VSITIIASRFHYVVERVPIGNIHQRRSAIKRRQGRQFLFLDLAGRMEQQTQRRFDQLGHRASLPGRFLPEPGHDGVINIERRLHMVSHI
jgi:hypothetical protein